MTTWCGVDDCVAIFREKAAARGTGTGQRHPALAAWGTDQYSDAVSAGVGVVKAETSELLAVLDALDRPLTDIIFGLRDGTLLPDQQERFGQLFEAIGLLLRRHADLALAAIDNRRTARQQVPARASGRKPSGKPGMAVLRETRELPPALNKTEPGSAKDGDAVTASPWIGRGGSVPSCHGGVGAYCHGGVCGDCHGGVCHGGVCGAIGPQPGAPSDWIGPQLGAPAGAIGPQSGAPADVTCVAGAGAGSADAVPLMVNNAAATTGSAIAPCHKNRMFVPPCVVPVVTLLNADGAKPAANAVRPRFGNGRRDQVKPGESPPESTRWQPAVLPVPTR
jgi:hypothetical protein